MSYYRVLGLEQEPFSTSPDPGFFFASEQHRSALCRLQIAIALKRGMSVMIGDIGTGKTTVSRKLSQVLNEDDKIIFRMILNPYFRTEKQFLSRMAAAFRMPVPKGSPTSLDYMEAIERYLFAQGVEEEKTVVLLIDEAQILPDFVFEVLRILLNYETNQFKILQLVLVGQMELLPRITAMANFWDRVSAKVMLKPLEAGEVRGLIESRLRSAGYKGRDPLFTSDAVGLVWEHTGGYPRRVNLFCHNVLEHMVMHGKQRADLRLVHRVIEKEIEMDDFRGLVSEVPQVGGFAEDDRAILRVVGA
jgi:type II secretory pathway predicted ATPase ExeA